MFLYILEIMSNYLTCFPLFRVKYISHVYIGFRSQQMD